MDIVCGKCGKHLSSIDHCREHIRGCKGSSSEGLCFCPISSIPKADYVELVRLMLKYEGIISKKDKIYTLRSWRAFLVFLLVLVGIGFLVYLVIGGS